MSFVKPLLMSLVCACVCAGVCTCVCVTFCLISTHSLWSLGWLPLSTRNTAATSVHAPISVSALNSFWDPYILYNRLTFVYYYSPLDKNVNHQ